MERPTTEQVRQELTRTEYGRRYRAAMRSTVYTLVVVAAVAILVATLLLPVLRTYGKSMTPTLDDGNIVFSVKASSVERGDIIAFYYNNKILIKRVVGISGEWIDIDQDGAVYVNGKALDEPYVTDPALANATSSCPIRCRRTACSSWAITDPPRWTPVPPRSAASRRSRSSESCCSAYGPCPKWGRSNNINGIP